MVLSWIKIGSDVNESHVSLLILNFRILLGMDINKANNYDRAIVLLIDKHQHMHFFTFKTVFV